MHGREVTGEALVVPGVGRFRFDPRGREELVWIAREVFGGEGYLAHGLTLEPGATVVDAGANIGMFTVFAHARCAGRCRILAFEPIPDTFRYLTLNAGELAGVRLVAAGLTRLGGPASARFTFYPRLPCQSTQDPVLKGTWREALLAALLRAERAKDPAGYAARVPQVAREVEARFEAREVECPLTTLSAACRAHGIERIDLLKVDTEGVEIDVLEGLDDDTWPRVRQVALEAHRPGDGAAIAAMLRRRGFGTVVVETPRWASALRVEHHQMVYARR